MSRRSAHVRGRAAVSGFHFTTEKRSAFSFYSARSFAHCVSSLSLSLRPCQAGERSACESLALAAAFTALPVPLAAPIASVSQAAMAVDGNKACASAPATPSVATSSSCASPLVVNGTSTSQDAAVMKNHRTTSQDGEGDQPLDVGDHFLVQRSDDTWREFASHLQWACLSLLVFHALLAPLSMAPVSPLSRRATSRVMIIVFLSHSTRTA